MEITFNLPWEVLVVIFSSITAMVGGLVGRKTRKLKKPETIKLQAAPVPTIPIINRRYRFVAADELGGHPRRIYVNPDDETDRLILED